MDIALVLRISTHRGMYKWDCGPDITTHKPETFMYSWFFENHKLWNVADHGSVLFEVQNFELHMI